MELKDVMGEVGNFISKHGLKDEDLQQELYCMALELPELLRGDKGILNDMLTQHTFEYLTNMHSTRSAEFLSGLMLKEKTDVIGYIKGDDKRKKILFEELPSVMDFSNGTIHIILI